LIFLGTHFVPLSLKRRGGRELIRDIKARQVEFGRNSPAQAGGEISYGNSDNYIE